LDVNKKKTYLLDLYTNTDCFMTPKLQYKTILLIVVSFAIHYLLLKNFKNIKIFLDNYTHQGLLSYILAYLLVGIPIFIGTFLINENKNITEPLGISSSLYSGIQRAIIFTIPMFVGGLLCFTFQRELDWQQLIAGTLIAGMMEELYYRGFLFGQLFRKTHLGFVASIFLSAVLFAIAHLYQSENTYEMMGIFLLTFAGAIFFAWLYVEWQYNLWVPIFTHTFMNLSWALFQIDNSALGGFKANIFRGLTIAVAILFTLYHKKKKNEKLIINKNTLWLYKK